MNNAEIEQSVIERFGTPRKLEEIPEEELRQAVAECKTFAGVRLRLGVGSIGCTNGDVKQRCAEAGVDCGRLARSIAARWEMYTDDEIKHVFDIASSFAEAAELLEHHGKEESLRIWIRKHKRECFHQYSNRKTFILSPNRVLKNMPF